MTILNSTAGEAHLFTAYRLPSDTDRKVRLTEADASADVSSADVSSADV